MNEVTDEEISSIKVSCQMFIEQNGECYYHYIRFDATVQLSNNTTLSKSVKDFFLKKEICIRHNSFSSKNSNKKGFICTFARSTH